MSATNEVTHTLDVTVPEGCRRCTITFAPNSDVAGYALVQVHFLSSENKLIDEGPRRVYVTVNEENQPMTPLTPEQTRPLRRHKLTLLGNYDALQLLQEHEELERAHETALQHTRGLEAENERLKLQQQEDSENTDRLAIELERAEAELATLRREKEWRPISTHSGDTEHSVIGWEPCIDEPMEMALVKSAFGASWYLRSGTIVYPTHWLPLPAPPASEKNHE